MTIINKSIPRRILCLLLAGSMVSVISCAQSGAADDTGTSVSIETTSAEVKTELTDEVPELDFGGAEFRTIEQNSVIIGFYSEESNGEVVNDAIFTRNRAIEERFNIVLTETQRAVYGDISTLVNKTVMSGNNEFELVFGQMYKSAADAQNGNFIDWNEIPYVNFTKPWYVKSINDATVGGKLYIIESDLSTSYFEQTWMMLYNKTKADELGGMPDLYTLVDEGEWTLDELNRLSSDVYRDVNGDTQRDSLDFYGFAGTPGGCLLAAFMYGANAKIAEIDDDLNIVNHMNDEQTVDVLKKLSSLFYTNTGTIVKTSALSSDRRELFPKGVVLFEAMQVADLIREDFNMRGMNDEFGVLPLPKYDKAQEEYYTVVDGGASVLTVPATVSDLEMVGAITEAMSALSYLDVIPAYSGIAVEQKGIRDEDSIRMMRNILDSRVMDFAYLYDGSKGWVMKLPNIIKEESSIVSSIESNKSAIETYYQTIIDYMTTAE